MSMTETKTVDEAEIEAEIQKKTEMARLAVQAEFDGIAKYAPDLREAMRIKHRYLAAHPGDSLNVRYGLLYNRVEIIGGLADFNSLATLLRMLREAGYKRTWRQEETWGSVTYHYGDDAERLRIGLELSPLATEEAVCKLVQTGEVHTLPIYEIQCHGKPLAPDPEPATP